MRCSRLRTALLTFFIGITSVAVFNDFYEKWSEPFVEMPQVISDKPIIIFVCPEPDLLWEQIKGGYADSRCIPGGGGA